VLASMLGGLAGVKPPAIEKIVKLYIDSVMHVTRKPEAAEKKAKVDALLKKVEALSS